MENSSMPKGQRVTTTDGRGEIVEVIGQNVIIKLDNGATATLSSEDVVDDSSAG